MAPTAAAPASVAAPPPAVAPVISPLSDEDVSARFQPGCSCSYDVMNGDARGELILHADILGDPALMRLDGTAVLLKRQGDTSSYTGKATWEGGDYHVEIDVPTNDTQNNPGTVSARKKDGPLQVATVAGGCGC